MYNRNYLGKVPTTGNTEFVINAVTGTATQFGASNLWTYNGLLSSDAQAAIGAANYFASDAIQFQLNDFIFAIGTDTNIVYTVSAITYPTNANASNASMTLTPFVGQGSIGTADIINHAVTYIKIQEASARKLLGNPTGSTATVSEVTVDGTGGLEFSGSELQVKLDPDGGLSIGASGLGLDAPNTPLTITANKLSVSTNGITYAKIQQETASTLLGNPTGVLANTQPITLGSGLNFSGTTLVATGTGGTVTQVDTDGPISGGPITGTGTVTINPNAIGYNYIQVVTAQTLLGNTSGVDTDVNEVSLGAGLSFSGNDLILEADYLRSTTVSLTSTDIQAMYGIPVLILAAPAANQKYTIDRVEYNWLYGSSSYSLGGNVQLQYEDTPAGAGIAACELMTAAVVNAVSADVSTRRNGTYPDNSSTAALNGKAIYISNDTLGFINGDADVDVTVWYKVY